jgi:hypothetical protein
LKIKFKDFYKEGRLYYPTRRAIRGTDIGMTAADFSKTFPSSDSTVILPFPKNKKKKAKRLKKD